MSDAWSFVSMNATVIDHHSCANWVGPYSLTPG